MPEYLDEGSELYAKVVLAAQAFGIPTKIHQTNPDCTLRRSAPSILDDILRLARAGHRLHTTFFDTES